MAREDLKAKPVSIYLQTELYEKLQVKAERELRTISQTAAFILTEYFKKNPQED
jgi:hypothetical protein